MGQLESVVERLRASGCVYAEQEAALLAEAADGPQELERLVGLRIGGQPLEHLVGWAEFCGIRIQLDPGVFVPRARTELLVEQALRLAPPEPLIVELCCGSGAISAALLSKLGSAQLWAADIDPAEVRCARRNLPAERVVEGDLFDPLPSSLRGRVDVLIANGPYVPTSALPFLPSEARRYEPRIALDGGPDGLDVLRRVIEPAPAWLGPGGSVIVQGSERQAPALARLIAGAGLLPEVVMSPDHDDATAVIGTRPGDPT
jgi:release factor glutamine methyltransferase